MMTVSQLIATLVAVMFESGDPDAQVMFDYFDADDAFVPPFPEVETWTVGGVEYLGAPLFDDGWLVLHP